MKSIQQAVTAPVVLTGDDGKTWTLNPITPKILSEFCRHINGVNGSKQSKMVSFDDMMDAAQTLDGMMWLVWRCAKANHSGVTQDQVWEIVTSIKTMQDVISALMDLGDEEAASDPPAAVGLET